jgi:hypothetical protein
MPASAQLSAHVSPSFMIKFDLEPKPDATCRCRQSESILDDSFWSHNPGKISISANVSLGVPQWAPPSMRSQDRPKLRTVWLLLQAVYLPELSHPTTHREKIAVNTAPATPQVEAILWR